MQHDPDAKKKLLTRLKKAEGQVAALHRMVEEETYCMDILIQLSAAQGALTRIGELVLANHIHGCVREAFEEGDEETRTAKMNELMAVFTRFGRLHPD